jgi:hypothetical protein
MTITYNRKAIMQYAHFLAKRGWSLSDALKSAWEAAKYIVAVDLRGGDKTSYTCDFPLVIAAGVTCVPHQDSLTTWILNYGAE